jgi:hypothetical protein
LAVAISPVVGVTVSDTVGGVFTALTVIVCPADVVLNPRLSKAFAVSV